MAFTALGADARSAGQPGSFGVFPLLRPTQSHSQGSVESQFRYCALVVTIAWDRFAISLALSFRIAPETPLLLAFADRLGVSLHRDQVWAIRMRTASFDARPTKHLLASINPRLSFCRCTLLSVYHHPPRLAERHTLLGRCVSSNGSLQNMVVLGAYRDP